MPKESRPGWVPDLFPLRACRTTTVRYIKDNIVFAGLKKVRRKITVKSTI